MKKILSSIVALFFFTFFCQAQSAQRDINRINLMPDIPSPYEMRDWKEVALQYDAFIFDSNKTGQYLPLVGLKESGINFPSLQPILLKTYVGSPSSNQAEAINIIPAIVGASLMGVDKSNQDGINWVAKTKDFYNSKNNQHVYLNGYNAFSGNDWWYDLIPNVFFYQLYSLYPSEPEFDNQFIAVADQWLKAVYAMGGKTTPWTIPQMNYRGWYLSSMTGNTESVPEPESAGTIAWLLYSAFKKTGEQKYLEGAQLALDFLAQLNSNPSYELQLPYGTLIAAKLNAEYGANYPIHKMLEWSFDRGPLRGWGTIVGKWDGQDISGLVGEANDNGDDYAFMMNGYQQAAALVPLVKYDKRYAKTIAKWVLNLANASRLFYPQFLDASKQDDQEWSTTYDPQSVIGYEALKENWQGKALYGTGDAKRSGWAATNLALYGSSHVGYLAAIVEETNVEGILKLDLNKTDFYGDNEFQSFLFYNPHAIDHQVTLKLGTHAYDIYDAISEADIMEEATGDVQVQIKAGEVMLLSYLPTEIEKEIQKGKLYGNGHVIDHFYGYDFDPHFRIKSFATAHTVMEFNQQTSIYALVENAPEEVAYHWYVNDAFVTSTTQGKFDWTSPENEGNYKISVEITSGSETIKDNLYIQVLERVPVPPIITEIIKEEKFYIAGKQAQLICAVEGAATGGLSYTWRVPSGTFEQQDSLLTWTVPDAEGLYTINCLVENDDGLTADTTIAILVKQETETATVPLAYYPLNINADDYSGNNFNGKIDGTQETADALGNPAAAYRFSSGEDIIFVDNNALLNFNNAITLSFWVAATASSHEAFILSHGSWEERWKVSITPEGRLRWTLKTTEGVKDLDSSFPLDNSHFYHITVVYSGYSMELYIDGSLDTYSDHTGKILSTAKPITFGQKGLDETQFYLNGVLDEVRIYDKSLNPDEIATLKSLWKEENITAIEKNINPSFDVFPNPSKEGHFHIAHPGYHLQEVLLFDLNGGTIPIAAHLKGSETIISYNTHRSGLYILKIIMRDKIVVQKVIIN